MIAISPSKIKWGYREENPMPRSRTILAPTVLLLVSSISLGGCATKGYVNDRIASVNQRIDALQARVQTVEGTANAAKAEADANSGQVQIANSRLDQLTTRVDGLDQRLQQRRRPRN